MLSFGLLVEGDLDEAVGRRLVSRCGATVHDVYGKRGFGYIKEKAAGFNELARGTPIVALVDQMDTQIECPPDVLSAWVPNRNPNFLFRLAVPEIESWLLADRTNIASFLGVARTQLPRDPEDVKDPKRTLISIARQSRHSRVTRLLVPQGSTATEGPGYTSEMQTITQERWDIAAACERSPSLSGSVRAIQQYCEEHETGTS